MLPPITRYSAEWWESAVEDMCTIHRRLVLPREPPASRSARDLYERERRHAEAMVSHSAKTPGMVERLEDHLDEMAGELLGTFESLTMPRADHDEDVLRIVRSRFQRAREEHNTLKAFAGAYCLIRDRNQGYPGEPWRRLLDSLYRDEERPQVLNRKGALVYPKRPEYALFDRVDCWFRNNSARGRAAKQKYDSQPTAKEKRKLRSSTPEAQAHLKKKRAEDYRKRKDEKPSKDAQAAALEQILQQVDEDNPKPTTARSLVTKRAPRPVEPQQSYDEEPDEEEPTHEEPFCDDFGSEDYA